MTSPPKTRRTNSGATTPAAPFPLSSATFNLRAPGLISARTHSIYSSIIVGCALSEGAQFLNILAVQGILAHHHLAAVIFGRIMTAGDLNDPVVPVDMAGKIDQRRGHHPQVNDVDPCTLQTRGELREDPVARAARVAPHRDAHPGLGGALRIQAQQSGRVGAADLAHRLVV